MENEISTKNLNSSSEKSQSQINDSISQNSMDLNPNSNIMNSHKFPSQSKKFDLNENFHSDLTSCKCTNNYQSGLQDSHNFDKIQNNKDRSKINEVGKLYKNKVKNLFRFKSSEFFREDFTEISKYNIKFNLENFMETDRAKFTSKFSPNEIFSITNLDELYNDFNYHIEQTKNLGSSQNLFLNSVNSLKFKKNSCQSESCSNSKSNYTPLKSKIKKTNFLEMEIDSIISSINYEKLKLFLGEFINERKIFPKNINELELLENNENRFNLIIETCTNFYDDRERKTLQLFKIMSLINYCSFINKNYENLQDDLKNIFHPLNFELSNVYLVVTNGKFENFQEIEKFTKTKNDDSNLEQIRKYVFEQNTVIFIYLPSDFDELKCMEKTIEIKNQKKNGNKNFELLEDSEIEKMQMQDELNKLNLEIKQLWEYQKNSEIEKNQMSKQIEELRNLINSEIENNQMSKQIEELRNLINSEIENNQMSKQIEELRNQINSMNN